MSSIKYPTNFLQWVINRSCQTIIETEGKTNLEFLLECRNKFSVQDLDQINILTFFDLRTFVSDLINSNIISPDKLKISTNGDDHQKSNINEKFLQYPFHFLLFRLYQRELQNGVYSINSIND